MFAGLIATAIALIVSKLIMKRKIGLVFPLSVGSMTVLVICAVVVYVLFG